MKRFSILAVLLVAGCGKPQMGTSEEVFNTVDALFTAVTARDPGLVAGCELRLHQYRDRDLLPTSAANYLDGVIERAKNGRWESAAEDLYAFMRDQRRDGPRAHKKHR